MSYKIFPTEDFIKAAKKIKATYPDFKGDLAKLGKKLKKDPLTIHQLDALGDGLYKCRIDITGKTAGKSYGARIIYLLISADKEVWMMTCFDKSSKKDLSPAETKALRSQAKIAQNSKPGVTRSELLKSIHRKKTSRKRP
jgi:hypothetical protein